MIFIQKQMRVSPDIRVCQTPATTSIFPYTLQKYMILLNYQNPDMKNSNDLHEFSHALFIIIGKPRVQMAIHTTLQSIFIRFSIEKQHVLAAKQADSGDKG